VDVAADNRVLLEAGWGSYGELRQRRASIDGTHNPE
jgi:hypothetical protein